MALAFQECLHGEWRLDLEQSDPLGLLRGLPREAAVTLGPLRPGSGNIKRYHAAIGSQRREPRYAQLGELLRRYLEAVAA